MLVTFVLAAAATVPLLWWRDAIWRNLDTFFHRLILLMRQTIFTTKENQGKHTRRATSVFWGKKAKKNFLSHASQVWSLTQFYSVDFSKSKIDVQKCVFNKRTIKVCVSSFWQCPGTSVPSEAHLTVSLYLCSSGSNTWGKSRALEEHLVSSKSPSRVRDGDEGVAGRNGRE